MTVTLNIENDAELRAYIKDCIKGQVMNIVREDFKLMVKEELERKMKGYDTKKFDRLQLEAFIAAVKEILYEKFDIGSWKENLVNPIVEARVEKAIEHKDWNGMVDAIARQKIAALIK